MFVQRASAAALKEAERYRSKFLNAQEELRARSRSVLKYVFPHFAGAFVPYSTLDPHSLLANACILVKDIHKVSSLSLCALDARVR